MYYENTINWLLFGLIDFDFISESILADDNSEITKDDVVGCVGIILGFFLGIAGEKFKVETDPREDAILEVLPGNNCG